jgi:hypothetical protein
MLGRVVSWLKDRDRVFRRIGLELIFPLICGIVWGLIAWYRQTDGFQSISIGAVAFFFVLSMQNWVLRAAKNVRDEDTRTEVISIGEGVAQLLRQGAAPQSAAIEGQPEASLDFSVLQSDFLDSRRYFEEADRALDRGLNYSAVVVAAVGFERALRNFGLRYFDIERKRPLGQVLNEIGKLNLGKRHAATLRTLVQLRNGLVHGDSYSSKIEESEALTVVSSFMKAIAELQTAASLLQFERAATRAGYGVRRAG